MEDSNCRFPVSQITNSLTSDERENLSLEMSYIPSKNINVEELREKNRRNTIKLITERKIAIEDYLSSANMYNEQKLNYINLDDQRLNTVLNSKSTLNYSIHALILNMLSSQILTMDKTSMIKDDLDQIYNYYQFISTDREGVRNVFENIKILSDTSAEGIVLQSGIYVIKVPKNGYDTLMHEACVGFLCINSLKRFIPNFAYTYGYGSCSLPIFNNKNEVISFCDSKSSSSFLVLENVKNSVPLAIFVNNHNYSEIVLIFLQLLNALNIAFNQYRYIHSDLHPYNIVVRDFGDLITVPIHNDNLDIVGTINTRYIPYILDYGFNSFEYNKQVFTPISNILHADLGNWAYDMYVLLIYLNYSINKSGIYKKKISDKLQHFYNFLWRQFGGRRMNEEMAAKNKRYAYMKVCAIWSKDTSYYQIMRNMITELGITLSESVENDIDSGILYDSCLYISDFENKSSDNLISISRYLDSVYDLVNDPNDKLKDFKPDREVIHRTTNIIFLKYNELFKLYKQQIDIFMVTNDMRIQIASFKNLLKSYKSASLNINDKIKYFMSDVEDLSKELIKLYNDCNIIIRSLDDLKGEESGVTRKRKRVEKVGENLL
jgi:hypothetical protein